ncbi:Os05g0575000, partial [Oryza sativa Japonica Group]
RWSDRRQCPPWRANSLENIVPENLPRPSARRRFNSITAAAAAESAPPPASASPDAVLPFLAPRSGMGCFSL